MTDHAILRLAARHGAEMRALNTLFAEAFDDADHYLSQPPDDDYLTRLLADPSLIVLVAQRDGAVVGGLTAYILPKLERACGEVYIYDLAVAESCRRQGIATALIAAVKRAGQAAGATVTYVQADRGDDPAIALYSRLGDGADVLHFDL